MDWPAGNARQTEGERKEVGRMRNEVSLSRFICRRRRLTHVK